MNLRHIEKLDSGKIKIVKIISVFLGFSGAISAYVISSYFKSVSGSDNVGFFYIIVNAAILFCLLSFPRLINSFGKRSVFIGLVLTQSLFLVFLSLLRPSWISVFILMVTMIMNILIYATKDMILETYSMDAHSGRIKGGELALYNLGFLFGPLVSTYLLQKCGFNMIFLLQSLIFLLIFIFARAHLQISSQQARAKQELNLSVIARKVRLRLDFIKIYSISLALNMFYAVMVIFSPLYLLEKGFTWQQIGIAFSFMLIPFVIVEYPVGYLADKKYGEKEIMAGALLLISASTLIFSFLNSYQLIIWAFALFVMRIGAATLDISQVSYFYKRIDGSDFELIDVFMTASPVAYLIVAAVTSLLLNFLPLQSLFVVISIVVLFGLIPVFLLEDNEPKK
jgi:MFS family permease